MKNAMAGIVFFTLFAFSSVPIFSDVISPEQEICLKSKVGDECTINGAKGSCQIVKNGRCRFHPDTGTTCVDALLCRPSDQQGGCSIIDGTTWWPLASVLGGFLTLWALRRSRHA